MKLLGLMQDGYTLFVKDGQITVLYFLSLFLLWFLIKDKQELFKKYATLILLLLLFPPTAWLLMKYQTTFYDYVNLWTLLPQTAMVAYVLTVCGEKLAGYRFGKTKRKLGEGPAIAVLAVLLFLCGSLTLFVHPTEETGRYFPKDVEEVLGYIDTSGGEVYLFAPEEVAEYARIYDGRIKLPFGRNMWEVALSAYTYDTYDAGDGEMNDWLNGNLKGLSETEVSENYFSICSSRGFDYLVFDKERVKESGFSAAVEKQSDYDKIAETGKYVIYKRM